MKINDFSRSSGVLRLNLNSGIIEIKPVTDNILRIRHTAQDSFSTCESLMCVPLPEFTVQFDLHETKQQLILKTKKIELRISKQNSAFTYCDADGNIIAKEPEKGGKTLIPVDLVKTVFDENTTVETDSSADGMRSHAKNYREVVDRKSYHTKLEFEWDDDEALYGLGSHEEGIMNLRGHHQYLYQQNFKAVVPFLISTNGYGILFDSYSLMTFHDDVYGSYIWSEYNDELDFYFIYGPEFDEIIGGYRTLTGKAPMFPLWAFGYIQSKERYKTQQELIDIVSEYRKRGIPLDGIVLDWMSWTGDLWGQKSLDPERFPNPKEMMDILHSMNARLMVSIWPIMRKGGSNHSEMSEKGYLLGNQATYDAFNEKARQLYWKQANEGIFSHGTDAWWCDCTEPFESDWNGEYRLEPERRLMVNTEQSKKYLDPQFINAYSLQHSKGIYEGQRKTTSEKRVVNLTRSAYAGQQRYGTITWSGDIAAKWETLRKQIPAGLNFCASGLPYWTLDIGAFFVKKGEQWFWDGDYDNGCDDLGYRELYVRWFQYGAFLPMFRSHGTDTPREVWRFGEPGSIFYDTLVKFDRLRYRLLPFIYSLAASVTLNDYTIMRALPFDFRNDRNTYNINDQYMFGPSIMVCPVTEPMYYSKDSIPLKGVAKKRSVYLPDGCDWYDFWTGERYKGGQTIQTAAPLDIMPLFIRSGSIIPLGPSVQYSSEKPGAAIELRVYGEARGDFILYEDEGDGYGYEENKYATSVISWDGKKNRICIGSRSGSFKGMPESREFRIVKVAENHGTGIEETADFDAVVRCNGEAVTVTL
jgi:alpha-D-xyloside xylohydrolase